MVVIVNMVRISYLLGTVYHTGGDITASTELTYDEFVRDIHGIILTEQGNCPVSSLLQMLQGKWKFQILYEICIKDPIRYGELKRVIPGITSTMLSASLKDLERIRETGIYGVVLDDALYEEKFRLKDAVAMFC